MLLRQSARLVGGHLSGEWSALSGALEVDVAGACPGNRVALGIGDRNQRVVERRVDVRNTNRDVLALLLFALLYLLSCHVLLVGLASSRYMQRDVPRCFCIEHA